jgi:hypothetical protein
MPFISKIILKRYVYFNFILFTVGDPNFSVQPYRSTAKCTVPVTVRVSVRLP